MTPRTKRVAPVRGARPARDGSLEPASSEGNGARLSDQEIVRVARRLIAEVGVDGLTMRRLSNELGVALGATYHHVPAKRDVLVLVGRQLYHDTVPPETGPWYERIKILMLDIADVVGQYPGMGTFVNANASDVVPVELTRAVVEILNDAGFTRRGTNAVMSALFFYVTGMNMGGPAVASSSAMGGANLKQLFEDGLDILIAGARDRLKEDRKAVAAKRLVTASRPRRGSTS